MAPDDDQEPPWDLEPPSWLVAQWAEERAQLERASAHPRPGAHQTRAPAELEQRPATGAEPRLRVADLAGMLAGDIPEQPPVWGTSGLTVPVLYPGMFHDLHGEPSSGKTWVALAIGLEFLRAGHGFLFLDWEDSPRTFIGRMLALGAHPDLLGDPSMVTYVTPEGPMAVLERDLILDEAQRLHLPLVLLDAVAPALALDGSEENSNTDVAGWIERMVRPLERVGATVLALDHVAKNAEGRARGGRGAGAKLGGITGASYEVVVTRPFSRTTAGELRLKIAKDRHGYVGPVGHTAARVIITPDDGAVDLKWAAVEDATDELGRFTPTVVMEKVSRHLEQSPTGTFSKREIQAAITGKNQVISAAVDRLAELGHLSADQVGRSIRYAIQEPYRKPSDDVLPDRAPDRPRPTAPPSGPNETGRAPTAPPDLFAGSDIQDEEYRAPARPTAPPSSGARSPSEDRAPGPRPTAPHRAPPETPTAPHPRPDREEAARPSAPPHQLAGARGAIPPEGTAPPARPEDLDHEEQEPDPW